MITTLIFPGEVTGETIMGGTSSARQNLRK